MPLLPVHDTHLFVEERGEGFPLLVLHGGPGLDSHEFADYLDPLTDAYRLVFIDQRAQGRSDRDADPEDPRIAEYERRTAGTVYAPAVLRAASLESGGLGIEVEDALHRVHQPLLACTGRHDRTCVVAASERIAELVQGAQLHVFERSGHMTFVEQPEEYVAVVRAFLDAACGDEASA